MNDDISGGASEAEAGTDWGGLRRMSDAEARAAVAADPDVRPTDAAFWEEARLVLPRRKETVTIRLDADLLAWLRREPGYQTRINAVLRGYMAGGGGERVARPSRMSRVGTSRVGMSLRHTLSCCMA